MAGKSRYCEYNCDYMCNVCLQKEMEAERRAQSGTFNPLLDDNDDGMGWMGMPKYTGPIVDDTTGELVGFPLTKYSPTGGTVTTTPYIPEPMKLLVEEAMLVIDDEPVVAEGPDKLIKGMIVV